MKVQLKPPTNGKLQCEIDDELDKLAEFIPDDTALPVDDLPAPNALGRSDAVPASQPQLVSSKCVPKPAKATQTVNVKALLEFMANAYTDNDPNTSIYVDGREIVIEQKRDGMKHSWKIGLSHVRTYSVKLIK